MEPPIQKYEQVLSDHVGGFGIWQLVVILAMFVPGVFRGCELLISTLAGPKTDFRCAQIPLCQGQEDSTAFFTGKGTQCQALVEKDTGKFVPYCEYNSSIPNGVRLQLKQRKRR